MLEHLDVPTDEAPDVAPSKMDARQWKRVGTGAAGAGLLALGLGRRSLGGAALALVGGWLSYRAVRGRGRPDRRGAEDAASPPTVSRSITVGSPADELSEFLRDPENLGLVVGHFADVTPVGEDRYRWSVSGPFDRRLSWETRLVEDDSGERLRWEPVGDAPLSGEWSVDFRPAPGDRGTQVTLRVNLYPLGGALGHAAMERLDVVPESLAGTALDRLKSLVETGEIPTLEGNPSARGRGDLL